MNRSRMKDLLAWKNSPNRKPLVLRGARQVGKTWLLKEFGRLHFDNVAYVRLQDNEAMASLFEGSLDPERLLRGLSAATGEVIAPERTLVVLDEVQEVPRALTALKYFSEDAPDYCIAVAGSLLGVALHSGISFPVGKVTFLDLYPMSFTEFLEGIGKHALVDVIKSRDYELIDTFRETLTDLLKTYYVVGGMPEAVATFASTGDFAGVRKVQHDILESYNADFSKHMSPAETERARMVFLSLPKHLAKENKKFVYGVVKKGARGRDLDDVLQFLIDAGLVVKVSKVTAPGLPLSAYIDEAAFKLFCVDVGLLCSLADIDPSIVLDGNALFTHFKGALAEQYVCQQLVSECELKPYYWASEKHTSEIDFLYQQRNEIVPVEVKAEVNLRAKSLALFCKANKLDNAVRLSLAPYKEEGWLRNVPLYAVSSLGDSSTR